VLALIPAFFPGRRDAFAVVEQVKNERYLRLFGIRIAHIYRFVGTEQTGNGSECSDLVMYLGRVRWPGRSSETRGPA